MIHSFEYCLEKVGDTGVVSAAREYIVHVSGLKKVKIDEGIVFETGQRGYVLRIDEESVWVVVFSKENVEPGTRAVRTGSRLRVSFGDGLLGNLVSPLGYVLDGNKDLSKETETTYLNKEPLGIETRRKIDKPLYTGVPIVDLTLPLGMGQRELIIGERKTGKTAFALQALAYQVSLGAVGIYCAIGKQLSEIIKVKEWFEERGLMEKIIIIAAGARDDQAEIVLAPYTAMSFAECIRDRGQNAVVVLDDMTTHAKYYREISLLAGRFPGRDSYPGDIFYEQSRILERAGCFEIEGKTRTISCLPIAESTGGDMTGYIQTNLMSITDGHIFFDLDKFQRGTRPAINIFLSVTRVGRQTREQLLHSISNEMYTILRKVDEAGMFAKFGPEQTEEVRKTLVLGNNLNLLVEYVPKIGVPEWKMIYLLARLLDYKKIEKSAEEILEELAEEKKAKKWKEKLDQAINIEQLVNYCKETVYDHTR